MLSELLKNQTIRYLTPSSSAQSIGINATVLAVPEACHTYYTAALTLRAIVRTYALAVERLFKTLQLI